MQLNNSRQFAWDLGKGLADIFAPARCMGCLREGEWLCSACSREIIFSPLVCVGCGKQQPQGRVCQECRKKMALTGVVSVGVYGSDLLRRGVHWLKFKGIVDVAPALAYLMAARITTIAPLAELRRTTALVPVPLHSSRLKQRGFNQSELLAHELSKWLDLPMWPIVQRRKKTWTQAMLPADLRADNVRAAFELKEEEKLAAERYIVVDDVTTSGATLSAVADLLWDGGTKEVWGLTVMRG